MELYTREQMIEAFKYGKKSDNFSWIGEMIDSLDSIKLPTDKQIHKQATNYSNLYYEFRAGAEWVIEHIKNQQK